MRQLKSFGSGKDREIREEYAFDSALTHEIREYTKEAGIELGQRLEKQDVTVRPGEPTIDYSKVPLEVIQASLAKMKEARAMLMIEAAPGSVEEV